MGCTRALPRTQTLEQTTLDLTFPGLSEMITRLDDSLSFRVSASAPVGAFGFFLGEPSGMCELCVGGFFGRLFYGCWTVDHVFYVSIPSSFG